MRQDIVTGWVDVDGGLTAYLARPAGTGEHPAVVVGFEMFGVTGYLRSVAERLARSGYLAIVPDFYHRAGERIELTADAAGRERGLALLRGVRRADVLDDVRATLEFLRTEPAAGTRVAMLGLSVGGHLAYYAATQVRFDALAVFYPGWLTGTDIPLSQPEPTVALTPALARFGTRVLVLTGAADHVLTAEQAALVAKYLDTAGVRHEVVVYPDTPHGFFCHERDTYRPAAADDAWARVTALFAPDGIRPA